MYIYNSKINKNEKNILLEMYNVISITVHDFSFFLNVKITSSFLENCGANGSAIFLFNTIQNKFDSQACKKQE